MNIETIIENGMNIAFIHSDEVLVTDAQSMLDLIATVRYERECDRIAISKEAVAEDFFVLSTGIAGEILQKVVNYMAKLAVIGDFSRYSSKPLHDFIYESNKGNSVFFVETRAEAIAKLARA